MFQQPGLPPQTILSPSAPEGSGHNLSLSIVNIDSAKCWELLGIETWHLRKPQLWQNCILFLRIAAAVWWPLCYRCTKINLGFPLQGICVFLFCFGLGGVLYFLVLGKLACLSNNSNNGLSPLIKSVMLQRPNFAHARPALAKSQGALRPAKLHEPEELTPFKWQCILQRCQVAAAGMCCFASSQATWKLDQDGTPLAETIQDRIFSQSKSVQLHWSPWWFPNWYELWIWTIVSVGCICLLTVSVAEGPVTEMHGLRRPESCTLVTSALG